MNLFLGIILDLFTAIQLFTAVSIVLYAVGPNMLNIFTNEVLQA